MASPCNELMSYCDGINEEMVELYEECTDLNFQPYTYTENNDYFVGDEADPDNNFFNRLQVDSHSISTTNLDASVCLQNLTNFCPYALISTPNVP